jgi:hypothetical protein
LFTLQNLEVIVNLYKKENSSIKFYPWCVNNGLALDFDADTMDIIDTITITD